MKIGPITLIHPRHCNGKPTSGLTLAALHWQWSLTWRWLVTWSPGLAGKVGFYFMRTYRYEPGINFNAGLNLPLFGSFSVQTQPNMKK